MYYLFIYLSMLLYNWAILHADFTHYFLSCLEGTQRMYVRIYVCIMLLDRRVHIK